MHNFRGKELRPSDFKGFGFLLRAKPKDRFLSGAINRIFNILDNFRKSKVGCIHMGEVGAIAEGQGTAETSSQKAGLEGLLNRLKGPTIEQRSSLTKWRKNVTKTTPEIKTALEVEHELRIKENLPPVVEYFKSIYRDEIEELRAKMPSPENTFGFNYNQHELKVMKDALRILEFKPYKEGMSDKNAQDECLKKLTRIMLYNGNGRIVGEEEDLIETIKSGGAQSPQARERLKELRGLNRKYVALGKDLGEKYHLPGLMGIGKGSSRLITVDQSSGMSMEESEVLDMDEPYYTAYYAKHATNHVFSDEARRMSDGNTGRLLKKIPEDIERRITEKWEMPPTQQTPVKAVT